MTRAFANPFLVQKNGQPLALERISLGGTGDVKMPERWLQEALFAHPESLPVNEIDPHIGPLIPVCMELETGSGPADILYVTPTGQVVLVETKLWRNPEARRAVVGQILDYAKQLTDWTFEILDEKASIAAKINGSLLLKQLRRHHPDADETAFVDGVRHSLATGDFLLLIVGDGIRSGAESLVAFLEKFGHLRFSLGLLEVAAYRMPNGDTLLQPRILARTEVLERTILMSPSGPVAFQDIAQSEDAALATNAQHGWFSAFWGQFLSKLNLGDASLMPAAPGKSSNQAFQMPPGGGQAWISAFIAQSSGRAGVYLTFLKIYAHGLEVYEALESDREAIEREIGVTLSWSRTGDKINIAVPNVVFSSLNSNEDRDRVIDYLVDMTQRMIRVMRPRLEAVTRALSN